MHMGQITDYLSDPELYQFIETFIKTNNVYNIWQMKRSEKKKSPNY